MAEGSKSPDMIYLLTPGDYLENTLEHFATDAAEIERIVRKHHETYFYYDRIATVTIDWEAKCVKVTNNNEETSEYVIHEITRVP